MSTEPSSRRRRRFRTPSPPRRVFPLTVHQEEEREARWRRERLGLPSPIDRWVAPAVPIKQEEAGFAAKTVLPHMARCLLTIERIKVRSLHCIHCAISQTSIQGLEDGLFADPDQWTLYGTAVLSDKVFSNEIDRISPCIVLDRYVGDESNTIMAPDWLLRQSTEETRELWVYRSHVAKVFARLAMNRSKLSLRSNVLRVLYLHLL